MEPHECIFETTRVCGDILTTLGNLKDSQDELKDKVNAIANGMQEINLKMAERDGVFKGGKAVVGGIGGVIGAVSALIVDWIKG